MAVMKKEAVHSWRHRRQLFRPLLLWLLVLQAVGAAGGGEVATGSGTDSSATRHKTKGSKRERERERRSPKGCQKEHTPQNTQNKQQAPPQTGAQAGKPAGAFRLCQRHPAGRPAGSPAKEPKGLAKEGSKDQANGRIPRSITVERSITEKRIANRRTPKRRRPWRLAAGSQRQSRHQPRPPPERGSMPTKGRHAGGTPAPPDGNRGAALFEGATKCGDRGAPRGRRIPKNPPDAHFWKVSLSLSLSWI